MNLRCHPTLTLIPIQLMQETRIPDWTFLILKTMQTDRPNENRRCMLMPPTTG